jgi:hypothetical protein
MYARFWWKNLKESDNLEGAAVDEMAVLRHCKRNRMGGCGLNSPGAG